MLRVFLPYVELFWKRIPASLEEIKAAGFDGVGADFAQPLGDLGRGQALGAGMQEIENLPGGNVLDLPPHAPPPR